MRCSEVITLVQGVTPLSVLVNLDTVLSGFGMEERGVMRSGESLEVVPERWAHLVENLSSLSVIDTEGSAQVWDLRLKYWPTWYHHRLLVGC